MFKEVCTRIVTCMRHTSVNFLEDLCESLQYFVLMFDCAFSIETTRIIHTLYDIFCNDSLVFC